VSSRRYGKTSLALKAIETVGLPCAYVILEILEKDELLAKQEKKLVILFFDEFQSIGQATDNHAIEAVLRQVAQLTDSIAFIFSGSNRHLLQQFFDDKNRPFYKLCERMTLNRIKEDHYKKHIAAISVERWGEAVTEETLAAIFEYTERHPYYLNVLCSRAVLANFPSVESIQSIWNQYVVEERSSVSAELELLSKNQKKLLTVLSRVGGTTSPMGREFLGQAHMPKASVEQALLFLEKRDYVHRMSDGEVRVADPLIQSVLVAGSRVYPL
jgi:hypothetical protein